MADSFFRLNFSPWPLTCARLRSFDRAELAE